ncbi:MspA family porin [Rhodococcus sp. BP-149]|nr:MspA family porin [Rhodococcus sp. BP-288]MBY6692921.1 MspA family porin [Rhodococcus sp. BP-188]MBY6697118.1 MspA family porin [Rhodococcus sp. BP-285]MBY6701795.1 MspA family porin [Rhodococcus sp. BP-283]MBY6710272.1 MspA family porin [Rhodococcus sp. BP-160]MBY6717212.1 MspA family porin [Rhodococcus sp. BP-110]MBY6718658.1 MspA family porin [Rhodococcus sp. BP-142]MBY6723325.1 MspA family porin [Rhodococcus sp. BP-149]MBY6728553.1 MspA family porin [Rhodococcus sp. BP-107]
MTVIRKPRRSRGLKSMSVAAVAGASVVGLVLGTGTANAGVDASNTVVDADGNAITINLEDTFVNSVFPLDGNPLTREWFGNGRITWSVAGPSADDFEGTVNVGYQVGYPGSIGGSLGIEWKTPTVGAKLGGTLSDGADADLGDVPITADVQLLPVATAKVEIAPGPGITQSESALAVINEEADITGGEQDAAGTDGSIQLANVHGTATGILGNVRVRPYASIVSATGDTAVAYGPVWTFN